jgi:hypothetical protein
MLAQKTGTTMHGQMRGAAVNVYAGSNCTCQQLPARPGQSIARYSIRATADSRIIGTIRWHPRQQRYVFVPAPDTCWSSRDLAEIGLWLRRLTAAVLQEGL